jgi:thymidylate synthase ThyX
MTIETRIIADSVTEYGSRLTTFALRYPRFIHAEFMTHRVFSRNASSSRAIPVAKIIEQVKTNPVIPEYWGKNQKGMQARNELTAEDETEAKRVWLVARDLAVCQAEELVEIGLHKQIVNRILEPWSHISVVVTATEWANFLMLRCHPDAQPEIRILAEQMRDLYFGQQPTKIRADQWHLPFVMPEEYREHSRLDLIKASVARCARVSYLTHDNESPELWADVKLHDRLFASKHMSPFEHQAHPGDPSRFSGNLKGWIQYRKTIPDEAFREYVRPQE